MHHNAQWPQRNKSTEISFYTSVSDEQLLFIFTHHTHLVKCCWRPWFSGTYSAPRLLKFPKERPTLGKFLPKLGKPVTSCAMERTFQRHSAQLTFLPLPSTGSENRDFRRRVSWFWRTSGSTDDNREIRSRSVATRKIEGPHGLYLLSRKVGVQPSFQIFLNTFLGWNKWFPLRVGQAKKKHTFLLRPFQLASFLGGFARWFQDITSQKLSRMHLVKWKNWLSPRIRVKLREKDVFHKKTQPSLLDPFWGQKPQKVSSQAFFS